MPRFAATALIASPALTARSVACDGRDDPRIADERQPDHALWILLRGRFAFRSRAVDAVLDPTVALVIPAGTTYAVRHPDHDGDVCVAVRGALVDAIADAHPARRRLDAAGWLRLRRALATADSALALEELIADALAGPRERAPDRAAHRLAARVRERLHADFDAPLSLAALAAAERASVFHLCRAFRRTVGVTIHQYQLELRLRHALALVLDRDRPLARIAVETGFASQSHLTNRFRTRFGLAPGAARAAWARSCKPPRAAAG